VLLIGFFEVFVLSKEREIYKLAHLRKALPMIKIFLKPNYGIYIIMAKNNWILNSPSEFAIILLSFTNVLVGFGKGFPSLEPNACGEKLKRFSFWTVKFFYIAPKKATFSLYKAKK